MKLLKLKKKKKTHQNIFQVHVIWEIFNIELISDIRASLSLWV